MLVFPEKYTVIDIETTGLSSDWDEIIELSAIKCVNDKITEQFSTLVKPLNEIDEYITGLTGITNEMVSSAPSIKEALTQYISFISDDIIVGHNVNFDINFIYDNYYDLFGKIFNNDFVDLLRLSKRLFPQLQNHKLSTLVCNFNIDSKPIHRGTDDCIATLMCFKYCKEHANKNQIDLKQLYAKKTDITKITADTNNFDEFHTLCIKHCVFTGKLDKLTRAQAAKLVVNIGGICENTVTQKTNYLILGNNDYCSTIKGGKSSKQKKRKNLFYPVKTYKSFPKMSFMI